MDQPTRDALRAYLRRNGMAPAYRLEETVDDIARIIEAPTTALGDHFTFAPERFDSRHVGSADLLGWYAVAAMDGRAIRSFGPYGTRDVATAACDTLAGTPVGPAGPRATLEALNAY